MTSVNRDEQGYNGWTNYETWHTALVLNDDRVTQEWSRLIIRNAWQQAGDVCPHYLTRSEHARYLASDKLKNAIEHYVEIGDAALERGEKSNGLAQFRHLLFGYLRAGFDEVDWDDIANTWLVDEFPEYERRK